MTMKINLDEMNPGTTFFFDEEDEEEGGWVSVRVLNGETLEEINRQCRTRSVEVRGNPPTRFETLQYKKGGEEKEFAMTWDYCIIDWKGVVNSSGQEIPCNTENKIKLMKGSPRFLSFVSDCVKKLNKSFKVVEEEEEKN